MSKKNQELPQELPPRDFEAELEESVEALRAFNRGENNLRTRTVVRATPPVARHKRCCALRIATRKPSWIWAKGWPRQSSKNSPIENFPLYSLNFPFTPVIPAQARQRTMDALHRDRCGW